MAARAYIAKDKKRLAVRIIKKTWEVQPHPDLAHVFAEIEPDETPAARIKRFDQLARLQPENDETRLVMAELNIVAEDFPAARRALGDLAERAPDARALTLMAAIERGRRLGRKRGTRLAGPCPYRPRAVRNGFAIPAITSIRSGRRFVRTAEVLTR